MDDLLGDIAAEKERINETLKALEKTLARKRRTFVELAAIATCLHNAYNGIENLLKRILKYLRVDLPDSETSHRDLVSLALRHGIISARLSDALDEYLAFRHFFVHSYGILLQEAPLKPLAENLPQVWSSFESALDAFVESISTNG